MIDGIKDFEPMKFDDKPINVNEVYNIPDSEINMSIRVNDHEVIVITNDNRKYIKSYNAYYSSEKIDTLVDEILSLKMKEGFDLEKITNAGKYEISDNENKRMINTNIQHNITWPMKIVDATDLLFSHNSSIALWYNSSSEGRVRIWFGEAWTLPDEYKELSILKFFGTVAEEIWTSDFINIIVDADDETPRNLPKKYHNTEGYSDNG